jgi:peptidoglycan/LPS O-acetylase OafA/YrhL
VLAVVLLGIRFCLLSWPFDPWRYYFAPTVWCFFVMGILSYRMMEAIGAVLRPWMAGCAAVALLAYATAVDIVPKSTAESPEIWTFYLLFAASLPLIFTAMHSLRWDNRLGDLSYSIYLFHGLVINIGRYLIGGSLEPFHTALGRALLLSAIFGLAFLLRWFVEKPIEVYRRRLHAGWNQSHKSEDQVHSTDPVVSAEIARTCRAET